MALFQRPDVSDPLRLRIARFKRLGRPGTAAWQGGIVRLPMLVEEKPGGPSRRPMGVVWVCQRTGRINIRVAETRATDLRFLALDALLEFGLKRQLAGCRPAHLELADAGLADYLREALDDPELNISVVGSLPEVRQVLRAAAQALGPESIPDALSAPGVTVDRMRAFADAAMQFHRAAPWRHLSDEDLIEIEAPRVERGLQYAVVLGMASTAYGLGFYHSRDQFEAVQESADPKTALARNPVWSLQFGPLDDLPFGDADLWELERLPVADEQAYPLAFMAGRGGRFERPDGVTLTYLEGVLRSLAGTTEGELDSGRWTRRVLTADGHFEFVLALPDVLQADEARPRERPRSINRAGIERLGREIERFLQSHQFGTIEDANAALGREFGGRPIDSLTSTASTPLERAQELAYDAAEARGRRRRLLARRALEISPDCADAYVVLAQDATNPEEAIALYEQGVEAGARALGDAPFEADSDAPWWGRVETRPYMRARLGLAESLQLTGRSVEAIDHFRELLRLNPTDNQGVRYVLLTALLKGGRDQEVGDLLEQFDDEVSADWLYAWALWAWRTRQPNADERLRVAIRQNRKAGRYLLGDLPMPESLPEMFAIGSLEEAVLCADLLGDLWEATPGASEWLRAGLSRRRSRPRS